MAVGAERWLSMNPEQQAKVPRTLEQVEEAERRSNARSCANGGGGSTS